MSFRKAARTWDIPTYQALDFVSIRLFRHLRCASACRFNLLAFASLALSFPLLTFVRSYAACRCWALAFLCRSVFSILSQCSDNLGGLTISVCFVSLLGFGFSLYISFVHVIAMLRELGGLTFSVGPFLGGLTFSVGPFCISCRTLSINGGSTCLRLSMQTYSFEFYVRLRSFFDWNRCIGIFRLFDQVLDVSCLWCLSMQGSFHTRIP